MRALDQINNFVSWASSHQEELAAAEVAVGSRSTTEGAVIGIRDHFDALRAFGVVICANRVRELVSIAKSIEAAPLPSDDAVKRMYVHPPYTEEGLYGEVA